MDEMVLQMRNVELENLLNKVLAEGNHVWVIGDVHGYANVLTSLIEKLALGPNDHVVLLGDMIDRGPNSCGVIDIVRDNSNIHSIKGNHEDMMIRAYEEINKRCAGVDIVVWATNGGTTTTDSFEKKFGDEAGDAMGEVTMWMRQLPSQIVLDNYRLVHAGYAPDLDMDFQTDGEMLSIRGEFHKHDAPVDSARQVIFGHTATHAIKTAAGISGEKGEPFPSPVLLDDERPAWIAMETGACQGLRHNPTLTAYDLQSTEFRCVRVFGG